jgi:hypothetical protein
MQDGEGTVYSRDHKNERYYKAVEILSMAGRQSNTVREVFLAWRPEEEPDKVAKQVAEIAKRKGLNATVLSCKANRGVFLRRRPNKGDVGVAEVKS